MFVGRARERSLALAALRVLPSSVAVVGPPGIGKTSFCEALSEALREAGAFVVWGRAWELGGAPAFFPWHRVFTSIAEQLGERGARAIADSLLREGDDAQARTRLQLFERAREVLTSAPRPLVVVLDDVHAADAASLELMRYLQRELRGGEVGLLFTAREAEIEAAGEGSGPLLRDLLRGAKRTVVLGGLAEEELDDWLPWFCGRRPPPGLSRRLVELTSGNPFFVRELIEVHGDLEGILEDRPGVPRGVREVIERQASLLDNRTRAVLRVAAVLGRDAKVEDVATIIGLSAVDVATARGCALAARLLAPSPAGELRFAHALVCDTLYSTLPTPERLALHAAVVAALPAARLSERTRHAVEAALLGTEHAARALALCREAGRRSYRALAFEESARYQKVALAMAEKVGAPRAVVAEVSLSLGEALAAAGDREAAARVLAAAIDAARELSDAHLFARAAVLSAEMREYVRRDVEKLELLEAALMGLGSEESDLTARVLARLATDLVMDPAAGERRSELAERALAIARSVGRPETIALALEARLQSVYGPDTIDERLVTSDEIVAHARARGDLDREIAGRGWRLSALLERGDVLAAAPLAREHAELAEARRAAGPRINAQSRLGTLAFLAGRFDEGFAHARRAREIGAAAGDSGADLLYEAQLVLPFDLLGQRAPLEEAVGVLAREGPHVTHAAALKALLSIALLSIGRVDEARAELAAMGALRFADLPADFTRVGTLAGLADAVVRLGDAPLAGALRPLLARYEAHNAMVGTAACFGAISRYLGRLSAVLGDDDEALGCLRTACEENARMRARPWLAWSELELAEVLLRRGGRDEAGALLTAARATAADLGMVPLLARVEALACESPFPRRVSSSFGPARATLRRQARGYRLEVDGRSIELANRRGLGFLVRLVETPGREVHALELIAPSGAELPREAAPDDVLDPKAKAALRARVAALRADIARAERDADAAGSARARAELEALQDHLAASLGPRGRSRRHRSAAERARVSVTVALKRAIAAIGRDAPDVAAHLERALRTGLCSYDPDPETTLRVTT